MNLMQGVIQIEQYYSKYRFLIVDMNLETLILPAIYCAGIPLTAGLASILAFGRRNKISQGLLFHSILPSPKLSMSEYHVNKFSAFLDLLKANSYETTVLREYFNTEPSKRQKKIALTFDDGLKNFYEHAYPLLEQKKCKITLFAVAGLCGKKSSWDVFDNGAHLSELELRTIAGSGHEIGSHTLTHASLPHLDNEYLLEELRKSKRILEDVIGTAVTSISFPHGNWNDRIWKSAQEAGYTHCALYRGHDRAIERMLPVHGVYQFDSPEDILARVSDSPLSISRATARIMSHFSKGTPVYKINNRYDVSKYF